MLFLGLPFSMENFMLFMPLGLTIAPPLVFLGAIYLVFARNIMYLRKTSFFLTLFILYAVIYSLLFMFVASIFEFAEPNPVSGFIKQFTAILMGFIAFFVFRTFFSLYGNKVFVWVIIGGIPSIFLACLQISSVTSGFLGVYDAVDNFRLAVLGDGITAGNLRTSGLYTEPSHFGAYLILIYIPVLYFLKNSMKTSKKNTFLLNFMLIISLICFVFTFSGTAFAITFIMALVFFLNPRNLSLKNLLWLSLIAIVFSVIIYSRTENYLLSQYENMMSGGDDWIGKVGGTIGPLLKMLETKNIFGFGLGGTNGNITRILPENYLEFMYRISREDYVVLKTLTGRVIAETGLIGFIIYLLIFYSGFKNIVDFDEQSKNILVVVLFGVLTANAVGNIGSFAHPVTWFWLAYLEAESRNRSAKKMEEKMSGNNES